MKKPYAVAPSSFPIKYATPILKRMMKNVKATSIKTRYVTIPADKEAFSVATIFTKSSLLLAYSFKVSNMSRF